MHRTLKFPFWGSTAKLAWISFSFFTVLQKEDSFLLQILAASAYDIFSFLIKSRTFTFSLKGSTLGNSLAVQWLGLHALTAEGPGSIPGWGTKIPQAVQCDQKNKVGYGLLFVIFELPAWQLLHFGAFIK